MEWLTSVPFAHRGLHDLAEGRPENSAAAFAAARDAGYGIELDVHLLADGGVAVFHDDELERMCATAGRIADLDRSGLRKLRLAGTGEWVPRLEEVLEIAGADVPVLVELKTRDCPRVGDLCRAVAATLSRYGGPAAVIAFDPRPLGWFRKHAPAQPRGQLGGSRRVAAARLAAAEIGLSRWQQWALEYLAVTAISRPHFVGYDVRALPHPATQIARRRGPLLAGIVTTPAELATAQDRSDNFVFEGLLP